MIAELWGWRAQEAMCAAASAGRVSTHILENEALTLEKKSLSSNGLFARPGLDPGPHSGECGHTRPYWRESMAILWAVIRPAGMANAI